MAPTMNRCRTLWICCYSILVVMTTGQIIVKQTSTNLTDNDVIKYFNHYQYMGENNPDPRIASLTDPTEQLSQACLTFQRNWGLEVTGELTEEMLELMSQPRCSVPDIHIMEETRRKKRYISFSKWNTNKLTYKISRYPQDWDLNWQQVDDTIEKAFKVWSDVSSLTFTRLYQGNVHIDIQFGSYSHGDYYPFDGPNGYLAHAFFPPVGNTHFDDSETWTLNANNYNFFHVAVHEFGHALGLGHNTFVRSAIMFPNYWYSDNLQLDYDDIRGIQSLYGPPDTSRTHQPPQPDPTIPPHIPTTSKPSQPTDSTTTKPPQVTFKPTQTSDADRPKGKPVDLKEVCKDPKIDAMMYVEHPKYPEVSGTYGFQGPYYFKINDRGFIPPDYPRRIQDDWPGIPDNIDAALYWSDDPPKNFIFKGNDYWALQGMRVMDGYPKKIGEQWGGLPSDLSAAFVWNRNGKTYFIKGDKYYRYTRGYGLDYGYPREVERNWVGIPKDVDAAFQWDNMLTYFFKGNQYWRFQDDLMMVADYYPRKISRTWFKCDRVRHDRNIYSVNNSATQDSHSDNPSHGNRMMLHYWTVFTALSLPLAYVTFH